MALGDLLSWFTGLSFTAPDLPPKVLTCIFELLAEDYDYDTLSSSRLVCKKWNEAASPILLEECTFVASKDFCFEEFLDHVEHSPIRLYIKKLALKSVEFVRQSDPKEHWQDDRVTFLRISTFHHLRVALFNLKAVILDAPVTPERGDYYLSDRPPADRNLALRPLESFTVGQNFRAGLNANYLGTVLEALPPMNRLNVEYVLMGGGGPEKNRWSTSRLNIEVLEVLNATGYKKLHYEANKDFPAYVAALAVLVPSATTLSINFGHFTFLEKFGQNLTTLIMSKLDLDSEYYVPNLLRNCPKVESLAVYCGFGVLYTTGKDHENVWQKFLPEVVMNTPSLKEAYIICKPHKFRGVPTTKFWASQLRPMAAKAALMAPMKKLIMLLNSNRKITNFDLVFDMEVGHIFGLGEHRIFEEQVKFELKDAWDFYPHTQEILTVAVQERKSDAEAGIIYGNGWEKL
ncbi:hypothetical protein BC629DRAFT_333471 [Irpex lacteus]|nr:hypothetical protein BC629DRAFT_333471 [Irpex lacteus]